MQPDQINMAVFFWYLVKNYLSSVRYCSKEYRRGTSDTVDQPCALNIGNNKNCPVGPWALW